MARKLICDCCGGKFPPSQTREFLTEDDDYEVLCKKCMTAEEVAEHFQYEIVEEAEDICDLCHNHILIKCEYSLKNDYQMKECLAFEFCKEKALIILSAT